MPIKKLFDSSNEFRASSKVVLKKEDNRIHLYIQGNKIIPKRNDKITNKLIAELYDCGFFEQLDTGDLRSFLTLTKTEEIVKEFLISKIGQSINEIVSKVSFYLRKESELIIVMWILSKFSDYRSFLSILTPFKEKLKKKLNISHNNIESIIAEVIAESLNGYSGKLKFSKTFAILKSYKHDFYRTFPSFLIIETTSDGVMINFSGLQALNELGGQGRKILEELILWAVDNFDWTEFSYPQGFLSSILNYLPTEEILSYLFSTEPESLKDMTFDREDDYDMLQFDLTMSLFKGLNYPDKQIRIKTQELIKKLGGSLLGGLASVISHQKDDRLKKNAFESFSLISGIPTEILENVIFKLGFIRNRPITIFKLFHKGTRYPYFDPEIDNLIGILDKLYTKISEKISAEFGKSHIFDFSLQTFQSDLERDLVDMARYLSKGKKLKISYTTHNFVRLILKQFKKLK